jgi:alginate O-acetyltransferase complex protein AlgI
MALMLTMLLGGLWHGANWTFVAWGGLHGLYLWARSSSMIDAKYPKKKRNAKTAIGLVSSTLSDFHARQHHLGVLSVRIILKGLADFQIDVWHGARWQGFAHDRCDCQGCHCNTGNFNFHWFLRNRKIIDVAYRMNWFSLGLVWSFLILMLVWAQESGSAFIYFQF